MLGKLLKQDFRATARIMLPLYAAVPVLGLFTNLITRLCENQNGFLDVEAVLGFGEDLVGVLLFLLNTDAAGFITGICLPVDGGFSAYSGV